MRSQIEQALETFAILERQLSSQNLLSTNTIEAGKERIVTYFGELPEMGAVACAMIVDMMMALLSQEEINDPTAEKIGKALSALGISAAQIVRERDGSDPSQAL